MYYVNSQEDKLIQWDITTFIGIFRIQYLDYNSWQKPLKPLPSAILTTSCPCKFLCAADKELVAGVKKYESRGGCLGGVPDMACSFGCIFSRCCWWWTLAQGSTFLPSTDQNPKYFQMGLFRLRSKPLSLLPSWALNFLPFRFSLCHLHLPRFLTRLTFSSEWRCAGATPVTCPWPVMLCTHSQRSRWCVFSTVEY